MKNDSTTSLEILDLNIIPVPENELKKLGHVEMEINAVAPRTNWLKHNTLQEDNIWFYGEKLPLPPGTMHFSLAADPAVTWWKGLKLFDAPNGQVLNEVFTQDQNHGPNSIVHTSFGTSTSIYTAVLTLSKAKTFGIHTDMYNYYLNSYLSIPDIQRLQGCNHLYFRWMQDDL